MADAAESTTLYHPNVPDLTRERSDPDEIKAHLEAGWLDEDPKVEADKRAEEEAEKQRRSEAAKKGARTRKKNEQGGPDPDSSDAAVVRVVDQTPQ